MNIVLLGGKNPRHKAWIREVAAEFDGAGDATTILDYANWDRGDANTDVEAEISALAALVETVAKPYTIVAKSIGTAIVTLANARGLIAPQRVVFLGIPLSGLDEFRAPVAAALADLPSAVVVQNEHDPFGGTDEVREFVGRNAGTAIPVLRGARNDTHDYVDFAQMVELAHER
ncbi:hypothetical protein [Rarobacter incanus]|uniref:hypothetical protein n=1 Tax=Rarobacter incanus TaxID=153494 RepID=UPI0011532145|nr:hypothetical protein [Rarobacter incanus]